MIAVFLCAGFATRMYPLTRDFPKPLLNVAGRPVIDYLMDQVADMDGLETVHVVSNHRFYPHFLAWRENSRPRPVPIEIHDDGATTEGNRLGACADLMVVLNTLDETPRLLVSGGDNIYRFDIKPLWERFVRQDGHGIVGLPEASRARLQRTGVLEIDAHGRVLRLHEKPRKPPSSWLCPPLYFFQPGISQRLAEFLDTAVNTDAPGHFIDFLCRREVVHAFTLNASRLDIGSIAAYKAADKALRTQTPR